MSQVHIPLTPAQRRTLPSAFTWWVDVVLILVIVAAAYGIVVAASRWAAPLTPATQISLAPSALSLYAGLSTFRMAAAYVLSLLFSLVYARVAVASRPAERVMIPLLDILQSIPIGLPLAFCQRDLMCPITSERPMVEAASMQASPRPCAQPAPLFSDNGYEGGDQHQPSLRLG